MTDPQVVPFRVFEAEDDLGTLARGSWSFGFDGRTSRVVTVDAPYFDGARVVLVVRTMPLDSGIHPRSGNDEVFTRTALRFAVTRSELMGSSAPVGRYQEVVDRARSIREQAFVSDGQIEVDGTKVPGIRVGADGYFAAAFRIKELRILVSGLDCLEPVRLRTHNEPVHYRAPQR